MATKYAEIGLGVKYRKKMPDGSFAGGPMYYLAEGLHAPWLGKIVAVPFLFFSIAISAVVDTNTMTGDRNESFGVNPIVAGASVLAVMRYGMARGIFSNEAGIGSAAVTCASAAIKEPAEQAIWGQCVVLGASILFGSSRLITYYNYVEKVAMSLSGDKCKLVVKVVWVVFIIVGSYSTLGFVWDLGDTCKGLIILSKEVVKMKEDFYARELPLCETSKKAERAMK